MEAEIGFSVESITESFEGFPNLLVALDDRRVRGIEGTTPHLTHHKRLADALHGGLRHWRLAPLNLWRHD